MISESPSPAPPASRKHTHTCFSPKEDEQLRMVVDTIGTRRWDIVASFLPFRTPRQCRDRYRNYLLDFLVIVPWTPAEDEIVCRKYAQIGPKWAEISKSLTGRSGNDVKNRWRRHITKQLSKGSRVPPSDLHESDGRIGLPDGSSHPFPN
jgi:hypothetical protein